MLDKQGVYDCLRDHHIDFEITDHAPLFSMDDKPDVELPYPEWDAKNLFIRDHKREHYYLITVRGSKRVDLKDSLLKSPKQLAGSRGCLVSIPLLPNFPGKEGN